MKQSLPIFAVMIFGVVLFLSVSANAQEDTPPPYPPAPRYWPVFPVGLHCESIDGVAEGPTWGEVTIGISNVENLKSYVGTIEDYYTTQYADFIYFERSPNVLDDSGIPPLIEACIDIHTQTVTALRVSNNRLMVLQDLVAEYGTPDIVIWGSSNISRTAFWFEDGIATLVYILEEYERLYYGEVGLIVYFPFQSDKDFEERWPYTHTNSENPLGGDRLYIPTPSEAQNPFDFDAMIATITTEPTRTPTPTYAPVRPTPTATVTS